MFKRILVPLDGSKFSESALPYAKICATGCSQDVSITFVYVVAPLRIYEGLEHSLPPEEKKRLSQNAGKLAGEYLEKIAAEFKTAGFDIKTEVLYGPVTENIVEYAEKNDIGLIIIGTNGASGHKDKTLGAVADKVLHISSVPVLMARPPID